jgi:hypothetical protein
VINVNIEFKCVGMKPGWIQDRVSWQAFLLAVLKFRSLLSVVWCSFPTVFGCMRGSISSSYRKNCFRRGNDKKRRPMKNKIRQRMRLETCSCQRNLQLGSYFGCFGHARRHVPLWGAELYWRCLFVMHGWLPPLGGGGGGGGSSFISASSFPSTSVIRAH